MRRSIALLVVLAVAGCSDGGDRGPPGRVARCRAAIDKAVAWLVTTTDRDHLGTRRGMLEPAACPGLYRREECSEAWQALGHLDVDLETTQLLCGHVYCDTLPAPRPAACEHSGSELAMFQALDEQILLSEGIRPADAFAISRRLALFVPAEPRAVPVPPRPPADRTQLTVRVTRTEVYIDGEVVTEDELRAAVAAKVLFDRDVAVMIAAEADVDYARVVAMMDVIRSAGASRLAFTVP